SCASTVPHPKDMAENRTIRATDAQRCTRIGSDPVLLRGPDRIGYREIVGDGGGGGAGAAGRMPQTTRTGTDGVPICIRCVIVDDVILVRGSDSARYIVKVQPVPDFPGDNVIGAGGVAADADGSD